MQDHYTLSQAARAIGVTPRILSDWIKDAGIEASKRPGSDARARFLTKAQVQRLADAHNRALKDDPRAGQSKLAAQLAALERRVQSQESEIASLKARVIAVEHLSKSIRPSPAQHDPPAAPQSQPGPFSRAGDTTLADLADTLKIPRVSPATISAPSAGGQIGKMDAARLVSARHGVDLNTAKGWPWPPEALASERAALTWALEYVRARPAHKRPHGWRWRCAVDSCPCQQAEPGR